MENKTKTGSQGKSGFTLIELMVVVGIVGILAAMAIPDMLKLGPHYRLIAASGTFQADLEMAQTRALKLNAIHCFTGVAGDVSRYRIAWDCNQDGVCDADDAPRCDQLFTPFYLVDANFEDIDPQNVRFYPGIRFQTDLSAVDYRFTPMGTAIHADGTPVGDTIRLESLILGEADEVEEYVDLKIYPTGAIENSGAARY